VLCLALLCPLIFVFRNVGFVHWVTLHFNLGRELQITTRESRFYIELSKPDEFPITLGLNNDDELKRIAFLYKLEKLRSGDSFVFDDAGAISLSRISGKKSLALRIPIGINSAGIEDLEALPGIGPKLGGRIVEYRNVKGPFKTIDELRNVDGIGEKKFELIKPFISLD
jgi:competence ComEA-like helix-hairpin-helix protein